MSLFAPTWSDASISPCGKYRLTLTRRWDAGLPLVGWVMLNPSTADASVDDPTIRRCIGFAKAWGCGGITVRNLFTVRTAYPEELSLFSDPVGPNADESICELGKLCGLVIVAWGANQWVPTKRRAVAVLKLMRDAGISPMCMGVTADGSPKHPLYLPKANKPIAYER